MLFREKIAVRRLAVTALAAAGLAFASHGAFALDKVVVGKGGPALLFSAIDVGENAKIWASEGLEIESVQLQGDGPLEKALTSGDVDIGLGSGPSMGFRVKGVPATAVAAMAGPPASFVLVVAPNGPIKTVADMKGKPVGVSSAGSLTDWLVHALSIQQGWGPTGIPTVPMISLPSRFVAIDNGDIAATMITAEQAYDYAAHGKARIIVDFGDVVKDFITHALIANNKFIENRPDVLKRFLQGWFKTVAYMKDPANRATSIKVIADTLQISPDAVDKAYDLEIKMLSDDGTFSQSALDVIRKSLPEVGVLDRVPEAKELYTDKFVPVKLN